MPGRPPRQPASLKVRALKWLAQREHSRAELRVKLLRAAAGASAAASQAVDGESAAVCGDPDEPLACDQDDAPRTDPDRAAEVDAVLDWLSSRGYLSDQRFIDSRIHSRQARFGNLRIERELAGHGLAPDAQTRQSLRESEFERARDVWRRKYDTPATEPAERVRQMRFLAGRGFSPEVIRQVVRGGADED